MMWICNEWDCFPSETLGARRGGRHVNDNHFFKEIYYYRVSSRLVVFKFYITIPWHKPEKKKILFHTHFAVIKWKPKLLHCPVIKVNISLFMACFSVSAFYYKIYKWQDIVWGLFITASKLNSCQCYLTTFFPSI